MGCTKDNQVLSLKLPAWSLLQTFRDFFSDEVTTHVSWRTSITPRHDTWRCQSRLSSLTTLEFLTQSKFNGASLKKKKNPWVWVLILIPSTCWTKHCEKNHSSKRTQCIVQSLVSKRPHGRGLLAHKSRWVNGRIYVRGEENLVQCADRLLGGY